VRDVNCEVEPTPSDNFTDAAFRIWISQDAEKLRGLLVLAPGLGRDGLDLADEKIFRDFAQRQNFALMSVFLRTDARDVPKNSYCRAEAGSGRALLDALGKFSELTGSEQIKNLPMLMWGDSAGGQFNYGFACFVPERVIGFAAIKGGYYTSTTTDETRRVPALFIIGEKDTDDRILNTKALFNKHRQADALWAVAVEPNAGRGVGQSNNIIIPYFEALIEKRLPGNVTSYKDIKPLEQSDGWLCNVTTHDISSYDAYPDEKKEAAWLPDENTAIIWQKFVKKDEKN
jgi:hypothetical protein